MSRVSWRDSSNDDGGRGSGGGGGGGACVQGSGLEDGSRESSGVNKNTGAAAGLAVLGSELSHILKENLASRSPSQLSPFPSYLLYGLKSHGRSTCLHSHHADPPTSLALIARPAE